MEHLDLELEARKIEKTLHHVGLGGAHHVPLFQMLLNWKRNKKQIYEMWGNSLTKEFPIKMDKEFMVEDFNKQLYQHYRSKADDTTLEQEKRQKYRDLLYFLNHNFGKRIVENRAFEVDEDGLRILHRNLFDTMQDAYKALMQLEGKPGGLLEPGSYSIFIEAFRRNEEKMVGKSPKLSKQVAHMGKLFNVDQARVDNLISAFSEVRDKYSREVMVEEETLVFSIHPMDFLTMSMNDSNWSSCFSPDGENAATIFSAMQDSSSFIVYIPRKKSEMVLYKSGEEKEHWNNKKFRILCQYSQDFDALREGRHYPQKCKSVTRKIEDIAKHIWDMDKIVGDADIGAIGQYINYYLDDSTAIYTKKEEYRDIDFDMGHYNLCWVCGQEIYDEESERDNNGLCIGCNAPEEDECMGNCDKCEHPC